MNLRIIESDYGVFKNVSPRIVISFFAAALLTISTLLIPWNPFALPGLLSAEAFLHLIGQTAENRSLLAYEGVASLINIIFYTSLF